MPPPGSALHGALLRADRPADDAAVADGEDVRPDQTGDQGLAEPVRGLHGGRPAVAGDRIRGEQHTRGPREDHPLHDHAHVHGTVVDAVPQAVGDGPVAEERGPAPADVPQHLVRADDVQVRVLLAGEGRRRQVLGGGAGPYGEGGPVGEPGECAVHGLGDLVRDGRVLDGPADARAENAESFPVVGAGVRQLLQQIPDGGRARDGAPVRVRGDAEAVRHADAVDPRERAQLCSLAADVRDA
ncbi:hypothetical protein GCM10020256_02560 [Streptomyces thermocoprophilus]